MHMRPLGRTGILVSELGFGAASLGEEYGHIDPAAALRVVPHAIERGINFVDTSPYYGRGRSEVMLGFALRGIPRDRYILCTKLGRYDRDKFDFSPARVRESVDTSRQRLGVDCLDVVLCHDIEFVDIATVARDAVPTLRELQREGKLRAVGASGYPLPALERLHALAPLDVVLSYGNLALHNRSLEASLPRLLSDGVGVINAAPFDMRLLTDNEAPAWHPASAELRTAVVRARALCKQHGKTLAQLAFQFAVQHPGPASTVVGTVYPSEIDQWFAWLDEPVDAELLRELLELFAPFAHSPRVTGRPENNVKLA